ncbi:MAG: hypothetical protein IT338_06060 [Thermomicrobiales bacterium]|nr:hypothetical protein [Thermomicrobiales bacterium]
MLGTDIALNHQVAIERHREFVREAKQQQMIVDAYGDIVRRQNPISEFRAAVATLLLRAGSWLMPDDARAHPVNAGLELRPGR